ncbi:hypothetical protein CFP56_022095, partial [Quercus suber]
VELRSIGTNPEYQDDDPSSFSLPEIVLFRSSPSSSSSFDSPKTHLDPNNQPNQTAQPKLHVISPEPHISSQFYTFNLKSHPHDPLPPRASLGHANGDPLPPL